LWCEDEARLGLKPVARRVWALTGTLPSSCGRQRFESLYVYGFARPATGRSLCLFRPKANAECMGEALAEFAAWADPTGEKALVLVVDNAGGHTAKKLVVPANVRLHPLPAAPAAVLHPRAATGRAAVAAGAGGGGQPHVRPPSRVGR
jgi:hypothetical protein